jgi:hypothetical protein
VCSKEIASSFPPTTHERSLFVVAPVASIQSCLLVVFGLIDIIIIFYIYFYMCYIIFIYILYYVLISAVCFCSLTSVSLFIY